MVQIHRCAICKRSNIKLYRPYGEFLRDDKIRCRKHIPIRKLDVYVPMIEDLDGSVWGYTSVPEDTHTKWKDLPDN